MSLYNLEDIFKKTKVSILNPQTATYAGIGITTVILAYYTLYESSSTKSASAEKVEEPEEEKVEEPEEEKIEEEKVEEPEPEEETKPVPEEKEGSLNAFTGGKTKKNKKTKSNRKLKKVKKNKTR
jgi:hypothetical protein